MITITGTLLVLFNYILWTAGREFMINLKPNNLEWSCWIVWFCWVASVISVALLG